MSADCCIYHDALNACAGDDICCDDCPATVPAPLKCETPCRDEGCAAWGCGWAAAAAEDPPDAPAVPVVHPEPGDRAARKAAQRAARDLYEASGFTLSACVDAALDVYGPAAVAAVRADREEELADRLEVITATIGYPPDDDLDAIRPWCERVAAALAKAKP